MTRTITLHEDGLHHSNNQKERGKKGDDIFPKLTQASLIMPSPFLMEEKCRTWNSFDDGIRY